MKYFIKTFGCQMNEADSERLAGAYEQKGLEPAKNLKSADLVVINTCSVRQSAEDRVRGLVNNIAKLKDRPEIVVTGCMLRYPLRRLKKLLPQVDKFVKLEGLIPKGLSFKDYRRHSGQHAWVPIMRGCDNFCTYCVVPYARGRERSRPLEEIYNQVKGLVEEGYREVTLLGQNVNSYAKNIEKFKVKEPGLLKKVKLLKEDYQNNFALLLALIHSMEGLEKISFITSNPHDMSGDIIKALSLPKIDRYLHLAVQSGDDQILARMNRRYTAAEFLELIETIRQAVPDIEIGTDIIVGFPGETQEQFENTLKLCQQANFSKAYISKYSPRPGTPAFKLKDSVAYPEKKRRWRILDELINQTGGKKEDKADQPAGGDQG